jgi:DNA-binding beta-propeller fold protein YncE
MTNARNKWMVIVQGNKFVATTIEPNQASIPMSITFSADIQINFDYL